MTHLTSLGKHKEIIPKNSRSEKNKQGTRINEIEMNKQTAAATTKYKDSMKRRLDSLRNSTEIRNL